MRVNPAYYFEVLYPFQDRVLRILNALETGFYLGGGTAASRGYLQHRFSDDLDFFMGLSVVEALTGAQSKAAGIFPADLARLLLSATSGDWERIRWIAPPPAEQFLAELYALGESLIL